MKKNCLVINDREPIPEKHLEDLISILKVTWYQEPSNNFDLSKSFVQNTQTNILVTTYAELNKRHLAILPELDAIIATTTAVDYIDLEYCKDNKITVCNTPAYTGTSVAEHAFALTLCAVRKLTQIDKAVRQGNFDCFNFLGTELSQKTMGIVGLGAIGSSVAKISGGFQMKIIYYNRRKKSFAGGQQVGLDFLLRKSDVIVLTLPLNQDSISMIGSQEFSIMKPTTVLVSISHDDIINRDALLKALRTNQIAAAGLDLHKRDSAYINSPNLVLSPRRAWYTSEAVNRRLDAWKDTLTRYLKNRPINIIG